MYKRIRSYFIKRHIKKLQKEMLCIENKIKWVTEHMFDKDFNEASNELEYLTTQLKIYNIELSEYKKSKGDI